MNQETKITESLFQGTTLKAFIVGILLCAFLSIAEPYAVYINSCSGFCSDFICAGAIVIFFVFVGLINVILGAINRKLSLDNQELIVIYSMLIITCAIVTWGFTANFIPMISGFKYFDRPAWGFAEKLAPYMPKWFVVQDADACKYMYEGLPKGMSIPWGAWIAPICAWSVFILAFYFVSTCIMVILRKQWIENERLVFPMNVIPLEIIQDDEKKTLLKPFFKNKLMWIGFAVSFLIIGWNGLGLFIRGMTGIQLLQWVPILRMTTSLLLFLSFPIIGFTYFVNLDISASFWFFHLIYRLVYGWSKITGFGLQGANEAFMDTSFSLAFLGMGSMITLVVYGLFIGRKHIVNVFKKAFIGDKNIDDSKEILSYRTAVFGIIFGTIILVIWLIYSGLNLFVSIFFLGVTLIVFIGLSRIMAEGGFGFARTQCPPPTFAGLTLPLSTLEPQGIASLAGSMSYNADIRTTVMTSVIHGLKLADTTNTTKKRWFLMIATAILVSFFVSIIFTIWLAYKYGGGSFQSSGWFFNGMSYYPWLTAIDKLKASVTTIDLLGRWLWTGIGMVFMFFLMFMRHRFQWWPVHYLGLPIADSYMVRYAFFSVFLGWLIKLVILKYGGIKTYRKLKPFFIGLIMGQILAVTIVTLVAFFIGRREVISVFVGIN